MQLSQAERPRDDELWSARDIAAVVKIGQTATYELIKQPGFPAPLHVGKRSVRWWKSEIVAFLERQRVSR